MVSNTPSGRALLLIIISASLASFMSSLDGTIVNIALPSISEVFNLSSSSVAWVSTIYLLVMAGSLLVVGKLTDLIAYKKIFLAGFALFTFGSFSCGFFPEMTGMFSLLLVSRVVQALGGVMMMVIAPALLSRYLPGARRAKGMAIVVLFASIGMALGPTLGGLLTEYISWNWIFYINVPIGIASMILGFSVIPNEKGCGFSMKGFDIAGAVCVFIGLAAMLFAFSEGMTLGWTSPVIIAAFVLTVFCVVLFLLRERSTASPILDLKLFHNRSFVLLNLILILLFLTFAGASYLLPFYLELVMGLSTVHAGLVLTVLSLGMMLSGIISGQIYAKLIGRVKYLIMSGVAIIAVGYFLLSKISPVSGLGVVVLGLACIGFGIGLTMTPVTTLMMGSVPANKQGMVSSITSLDRFAPMTIGVALFNLILVSSVIAMAKHAQILEMPLQDIALSLLSYGFDLCFIVSFCIAIGVLVISFFVSEKSLKGE